MKSILMLSALATGLGSILLMDEAGEGGSTANGARIRPDLTNYQKAKSASGASTKICGDEVSVALVGATLDETYGFVAKVTGVGEDVLRDKYGHANVGQQRMFLGNLIRGAYQSKDAEKGARVKAAFEANVGKFREGIDSRLAEAEANKAKEAEAKAKAKQDEKDKKAAERKAKKEEADKAKAEAKANKAEAKANKAEEAKANSPAKPAKPAQAAAPKAPAQPK
jgi:hypothetical protein